MDQWKLSERRFKKKNAFVITRLRIQQAGRSVERRLYSQATCMITWNPIMSHETTAGFYRFTVCKMKGIHMHFWSRDQTIDHYNNFFCRVKKQFFWDLEIPERIADLIWRQCVASWVCPKQTYKFTKLNKTSCLAKLFSFMSITTIMILNI